MDEKGFDKGHRHMPRLPRGKGFGVILSLLALVFILVHNRSPGSRTKNHQEPQLPLVLAEPRPVPPYSSSTSPNRIMNGAVPFPPAPPHLVALNVSAAVFYGRRQTMSILNSYLERNLVDNGGILHYVYFIVHTKDQDDLAYLDKLVARQPLRYVPVAVCSNDTWDFSAHYDWMPRDQLFVKIDDDVVFIQDGAIEAIVEEKMRQRFLFVSANVVNHPILSTLHHQMATMVPYFKTGPKTWTRTTNTSVLRTFGEGTVLAKMNSEAECTWHSWECALQIHENLIHNVLHHNLGVYQFPLWDFHAYKKETRWSANFFVMNTTDVVGQIREHENDEITITIELSKRRRWHSGAVGRAVVVHYAYSPQREGLNANTHVIDKYRALAKTICGYVLDEEGRLW